MHLSRRNRAWSRLAAAGVIGALLMSAPGAAMAAAPENLSDGEKTKIKRIITLMEKAWKDCKDMKLKDVFAGAGDQMEYEQIAKDDDGVKDDDPTIADALEQLKDMVDNNRFKKKAIRSRATVDVKNGVDNDIIILRKSTVETLCSGTASGVDKLSTKLLLGASIANEMTHVYHKWLGNTNKKKCDAEKDSDCASIKFLEAIKKAIEDDDNAGMPNGTVAAIDGDDQKVDGLKKCFDDNGVASAADIGKVFKKVCDRLGKVKSAPTATDGTGYKGRKERFEGDISATTFRNWAIWYYAGSDASENRTTHVEDETARAGTSMSRGDQTLTRFFQVPAGHELVSARSYLSADGFVTLAQLSNNFAGNRFIEFYQDLDDDGVPEPGALDVVVLGPATPGGVDLYSEVLLEGVPETFHSGGTGDGLLFHDKNQGAVVMIELDVTGLPNGVPPQPLFVDPGATLGGGFPFLQRQFTVDDLIPIERFIFGQETGLYGDGQVIFIDIDSPGGLPLVAGPTAPAQAVVPIVEPGVHLASVGLPDLDVSSAPGSQVDAISLGRGAFAPIGFGIAGPDGEAFVPLLNPLEANDLLLIEANIIFQSIVYSVPRIGDPIGQTTNDEDGDGNLDVVTLSENPPRLHFYQGDIAGHFAHLAEFALTSGGPANLDAGFDYGGMLLPWSDLDGRSLISAEVDIEMVQLDLVSSQPIQVDIGYQTVWDVFVDLDDSPGANETVLILRPDAGPGFEAYFVTGTDQPVSDVEQIIVLDPALEPSSIFFEDVNNDLLIDVRINDFNGGPGQCLINTGDPILQNRFVAGACPPPFCFGDADGNNIVNFNDITVILSNFLNDYTPGTGPGDSNGDGVVNFGDVTATLSAFLNTCP